MPNTFFASDHHFDHANIINFENFDGTRTRPFDSVEEMNEHMIAQHNAVVGPKDTCWFLGDLVIPRRGLKHIARMNGRKRLVMGNHDIFSNKDYYNAGIEDLHAFRKFEGFVTTHIPVHGDSMGRWGRNVHGHLHNNRVKKAYAVDAKTGVVKYAAAMYDERYYCVCMERLDDYKPISIDELRDKLGI